MKMKIRVLKGSYDTKLCVFFKYYDGVVLKTDFYSISQFSQNFIYTVYL